MIGIGKKLAKSPGGEGDSLRGPGDMMAGMAGWDWWLKSDGGLLARVGMGCSIFAVLAIADLARRGSEATRWREYLFLTLAVGLAMGYGAINDWVASGTSWEYFYYGKGLSARLGPVVPPDMGALRRGAVGVGLRATWTAGLIVGAALLIANNPRRGRGRGRVAYGMLARCLVVVLGVAAAGAGLGALAGSRGLLAWTNGDIAAIEREDLFRPGRFMCVYGMNLGGYVGGLVGTGVSVGWVLRRRRAIKDE